MKILNKLKDRVSNKALEMQDWFHRVGDNFYEVEKQLEALYSDGYLPDEVCDNLNRLEETSKMAEARHYKTKNKHEEVIENRRECKEILKDKEDELKVFKKEHHGILAKIMYNITPLRFFRTGREYQQLKKEIKILRKESKYLDKYEIMSAQKLEATAQSRTEASRAEARYKRIIVEKANVYKDSWKLIKECTEFNKNNKSIADLFGQETENKIFEYMNSVMDNWYYMDNIKASFDVKKVGKIVQKLNANKKIKNDEKKMMEKIGNKQQTTTNNRQGYRDTMNQQNIFSVDGINRNVVERMIKNDQFGKEISAEQYVAFLFGLVSCKETEEMDKILKGEDKDLITDYASKGAEKIKQYMEMSNEEKAKADVNGILKDFMKEYNDCKREIEEEAKRNRQAQQSQQNQQTV